MRRHAPTTCVLSPDLVSRQAFSIAVQRAQIHHAHRVAQQGRFFVIVFD